jgi:hypothetical protein
MSEEIKIWPPEEAIEESDIGFSYKPKNDQSKKTVNKVHEFGKKKIAEDFFILNIRNKDESKRKRKL